MIEGKVATRLKGKDSGLLIRLGSKEVMIILQGLWVAQAAVTERWP